MIDRRAIYIFFPFLLLSISYFLTRQFCQREFIDVERKSDIQPPAIVFQLVWPLLYVTTGFSWYLGKKNHDVLFWALLLLLSSWIPFYLCLKNVFFSGFLLFLAVILSIFMTSILFIRKHIASAILLLPLSVWITFAFVLILSF